MENSEKIAKEILEKICETDEIFEDCDMDLIEEGYMDSFSLVSIILELETKYGLVLQPTDIKKEEISTVNNFIHFLEGKENH